MVVFVVVCDPDIEEMQFQTDKTTVYMSHPATSECLIVTTVNDADSSGEDGPGSVGHSACNTDPAIDLDA